MYVILAEHHATLDTYVDDDWRSPIEKGDYVDGLVTAVSGDTASVKIGPYRAVVTPGDFAWTARKAASDLLHPGDVTQFYIRELSGSTAKVELEQDPGQDHRRDLG